MRKSAWPAPQLQAHHPRRAPSGRSRWLQLSGGESSGAWPCSSSRSPRPWSCPCSDPLRCGAFISDRTMATVIRSCRNMARSRRSRRLLAAPACSSWPMTSSVGSVRGARVDHMKVSNDRATQKKKATTCLDLVWWWWCFLYELWTAFQCRLFLLVQALIFGVVAASLVV